MPILHLHLKGEYFDQIRDGTKVYEYRLASIWLKRIEGREFDKIIIKRGYPKNDDLKKIIERPWKGYELKTIQHDHFGNQPQLVLAIKVN